MKNTDVICMGILFMSLMILAPLLQMSYAHQRALFNINGKDYLFVIGSANEPVNVDDKTSVTLDAYWPNASNPTDTKANGTKPISGLEDMLKVEISAGAKNMTSDLEPAFGKMGSYESKTFYPTVATTYNYKFFGDINGTNFDVTFSCSPSGEQREADNSTVQISKGVERKALLGGFGCPEDRIGFPEPYLSQIQIAQELNKTSAQQ